MPDKIVETDSNTKWRKLTRSSWLRRHPTYIATCAVCPPDFLKNTDGDIFVGQ